MKFYSLLESRLNLPVTRKAALCRTTTKVPTTLQQLAIIILVAVLSAFVGSQFSCSQSVCGQLYELPNNSWSNSNILLDVEERTFFYNRTFGEDPQVDSNTLIAWDSIVPIGQGSVRYPGNESDVYTLSAIHQLHCLWSIHHNFYSTLHGNPDTDALAHMRHCFDYLRQSLSCAADTTLEPVESDLGGVTGWGFTRRCRSFEQLKSWAEKRRVSNSKGFSGAHKTHHGN